MFYIDENTTESLFTIFFLNNTGISAEGQYNARTLKYVGVFKVLFLQFETAWGYADDVQWVTED